MVDVYSDARGAVPVVGIVLLVAVVVVLATVVTVPLLGVAEESADRQPAVAFETEQENESLTLTPVATESVDIERVQIRNETTTVPAEAYVEEDVERLSAGVAIRIDDNLLNSESLQVVYEGERDSHLLRTVDISGVIASTESQLVAQTPADTEIPVVGYEDDPTIEQYDALQAANLSDPFTLAVKAPDLAGEQRYTYAVTAWYAEFGDPPNDRLYGPSVPLEFDEHGIATVTIGTTGTDADVTAAIAPGSASESLEYLGTIEVPPEAEAVAVETE